MVLTAGPVLPAPRLLDASAAPALRWGVIGTGIGAQLVGSVHAHTPQRCVAWAGRDAARTEAAARVHGVDRWHTDVGALLDDPEVDAVHVATPHPSHRDLALAAIAAGKHVLVEKPIAMTAADAATVLAAARAAGVLAMEAMWTRYLPQTDVLRRIVSDGLLGDVRLVRADLGSWVPYDPAGRLWDPSLGGGAVLDVGIYPVSLASMVLGTPATVTATGTLAPTGVDATANILLTHADGAAAMLSTSLVTSLPAVAEVVGSAGRASLVAPFFAPTGLTLSVGAWGEERVTRWSHPHPPGPSDGYAFQVTAFAHYVAEGRVESALHPHDETVAVMATLDEIRRQVALRRR